MFNDLIGTALVQGKHLTATKIPIKWYGSDSWKEIQRLLKLPVLVQTSLRDGAALRNSWVWLEIRRKSFVWRGLYVILVFSNSITNKQPSLSSQSPVETRGIPTRELWARTPAASPGQMLLVDWEDKGVGGRNSAEGIPCSRSLAPRSPEKYDFLLFKVRHLGRLQAGRGPECPHPLILHTPLLRLLSLLPCWGVMCLPTRQGSPSRPSPRFPEGYEQWAPVQPCAFPISPAEPPHLLSLHDSGPQRVQDPGDAHPVSSSSSSRCHTNSFCGRRGSAQCGAGWALALSLAALPPLVYPWPLWGHPSSSDWSMVTGYHSQIPTQKAWLREDAQKWHFFLMDAESQRKSKKLEWWACIR